MSLLLFSGGSPAGTALYINGSDVLDYVKARSLTWKLRTLDLILVDPPTVPSLDDVVIFTSPSWTGTVASVQVSDATESSPHRFVTVACVNNAVATVVPAPFGLSDAPDNATTYGYRALTVTRSKNGAASELRASCVVMQDGLLPGMTVAVTSVNQAFVAHNLTVVDMTASWFTEDDVFYQLDLGDPVVTLSSWASDTVAESDLFPIDATQITDGAVTTPKLAANSVDTTKLAASAVIANVLNVGGTVQIDNTGITIADGVLTLEDEFGTSVMEGAGFATSWLDLIKLGTYNGQLGSGVLGTVPAGRTAALPYWTLTKSAAAAVSLDSDGAYPSGHKLTLTPAATGNLESIASDAVPVVPLGLYAPAAIYGYNLVAAGGAVFNVSLTLNWLDASMSLIDVVTELVIIPNGTASAGPIQLILGAQQAPVGARYATVEIQGTQGTGHNAANRFYIGGCSLLDSPSGYIRPAGSAITGVVTPTAWSSNQTDFYIFGMHENGVLRVSATTPVNLNGLNADDIAGDVILLCNIGTNAITLKHDTAGTAAFRFYCPGSIDYVLAPNASVFVWYDVTDTRWRVVG